MYCLWGQELSSPLRSPYPECSPACRLCPARIHRNRPAQQYCMPTFLIHLFLQNDLTELGRCSVFSTLLVTRQVRVLLQKQLQERKKATSSWIGWKKSRKEWLITSMNSERIHGKELTSESCLDREYRNFISSHLRSSSYSLYPMR